MTDRELELRFKKAVEACTPDVLDKVMAECDNYQDKVIPFERKQNYFRKFTAIAAACVVIAGAGIFGFLNLSASRVASIVSLEVNPSIELKINKDEEVLEANAMNADAEEILAGMKLKGLDIHTATNALIGSLLKHGYIDELANSILLSVEDEDSVRGDALQETLSEEINAILTGASVNASILSQYVDGEVVDAVSQEYQISHGKAALIEHILAANSNYTFEELSKLSVNELSLIISNPKNQVEAVKATGEATEQAYIGAEQANMIAFAHAGIEESSVYDLEVEIDYEYHMMVYDVEFESGDVEYEYFINAMTGEVVEYEKEYAE
ncbi:MAG: PepSY domain-containing protein [Tyzzerella sp.]|nr:PepSY domain-containing protein [Tyzzerella sp.]